MHIKNTICDAQIAAIPLLKLAVGPAINPSACWSINHTPNTPSAKLQGSAVTTISATLNHLAEMIARNPSLFVIDATPSSTNALTGTSSRTRNST